MKTIHRTNLHTVYAWLEQPTDFGHNGRWSIWFDGDTIYSYGAHFPIAQLVYAVNGEQVALCTTRRYSQTTACHVGLVRQALYHSAYRTFHVPVARVIRPTQHNVNHDYLAGELYRLLDSARGARTKHSILANLEEARTYAQEANAYARYFNLVEPALSASPPDFSEILERADRLS